MTDDVHLKHLVGSGTRGSAYEVDDDEAAAGSTLGGPKCVCVVKATGALEKVYSSDYGEAAVGTLVVHHWDATTGISLTARPGRFRFHPEHQEHVFSLSNGIDVREDVFVLSDAPDGTRVAPPAVYFGVELSNPTSQTLRVGTYAFVQLRGTTKGDVESKFDKRRNAIVAWNSSDPSFARAVSCSETVTGWETTSDHGKAIRTTSPGALSNRAASPAHDPLGVLHLEHTLEPGARVDFTYTVTFALDGAREALRRLGALPSAADALYATRSYYHSVLNRSVVLTPDSEVNRGVLWSKANMLRTVLLSPTGWSVVNDPTRSNNSVGRDTVWFAFGADYILKDFVEASLLWYAEHLEKSGMVVEYYDIRTGKTADYSLNINDNTPLLILALWHHYNTTGNSRFLERVYPAALKAAKYILSQRNDQGLVWCTAGGVSDWGIVGWRNVIPNYRLSGATTEVNSECYAALQTVSQMARVLEKHDESAEFRREADALRTAINDHLLDPATGLYYLNIDQNGEPRSDITSDLVFPVMFGVCDDEVAAGIISRLSADEFWTDAGIRTVPRNAPNYGATHGYGLLGGVWVGVSFWYAFAAARFNPGFMAYALASGFRHYSKEPRRHNTVPGQFSEWLHGETLVNQGMMLSPWFPPRYLWAAIEGAAGLDLSAGTPTVNPRLAPSWKWIGVRDLPLGERTLTWFAARAPNLELYINAPLESKSPTNVYEHDISGSLWIEGEAAVAIALRRGDDIVVFVGNTCERTMTMAARVCDGIRGEFAVREFNSMRGDWVDRPRLTAAQLNQGVPVDLEGSGFCILQLRQDV
ncbi:MAG TPA: hypothetical protein VHT05_10110 [Candidatus Elarobacter sp.]|nr:hypothetical protein [Candidatus Elarobacter sp.]